jgi:hypothetical protein
MKKIVLLLVSILVVACGEKVMTYDMNTSIPVVEGYLITGASNLSVKVYSMESFDENNISFSKPIKNLELYINDRKLTETADGTYTLTFSDGLLDPGKICNLTFKYNNQTVSASTTMPLKIQNAKISHPVIMRYSYYNPYYDELDIEITWDNPDNSYYQVYIWNLDYTGSTGGPQIHISDRGFGRVMMQPFQGDLYTLKMHDMFSFGRYVCYLYRINKDYAELYERLSSSDLANPVSFITNGLGVFTGISADTIPYRVEEIY